MRTSPEQEVLAHFIVVPVVVDDGQTHRLGTHHLLLVSSCKLARIVCCGQGRTLAHLEQLALHLCHFAHLCRVELGARSPSRRRVTRDLLSVCGQMQETRLKAVKGLSLLRQRVGGQWAEDRRKQISETRVALLSVAFERVLEQSSVHVRSE